MARRFTKVLEEESEEAFFFLSIGEVRWIYTSTLRVSV